MEFLTEDNCFNNERNYIQKIKKEQLRYPDN